MPARGRRIAIIGGGFSGSLLAVHLLRSSTPADRILLIERNAAFGRGIAYATGKMIEELGGKVIYTVQNERLKKIFFDRGCTDISQEEKDMMDIRYCEVTIESEVRALFEGIGKLDGVVHSIGFANPKIINAIKKNCPVNILMRFMEFLLCYHTVFFIFSIETPFADYFFFASS